MSTMDKAAEVIRMAAIRAIADGIFDKGERKAVRDLVTDYEKLAGLRPQ